MYFGKRDPHCRTKREQKESWRPPGPTELRSNAFCNGAIRLALDSCEARRSAGCGSSLKKRQAIVTPKATSKSCKVCLAALAKRASFERRQSKKSRGLSERRS